MKIPRPTGRRSALCGIALALAGALQPLSAAEPDDETLKTKPRDEGERPAKPATLLVQVKDGAGQPIADAQVRVKNTAGGVENRFTDKKGSAIVRGAAPGRFSVIVIATGLNTSHDEVELKSGDNTLVVTLH